MKSWKLERISGSTLEARDYCRQIYFSFTGIADYEYFRLSPRKGNTPGTYRRFHNKIKAISKRYPDDVFTLQYSFKNQEDDSGEVLIVEYRNGIDTAVGTETASSESTASQQRD